MLFYFQNEIIIMVDTL